MAGRHDFASFVDGENLVEDFIPTDAAIKPGNSGGGLINPKGELVGFNAAVISPGGNVGIGFAAPTNAARKIMEQLALRLEDPFLPSMHR